MSVNNERSPMLNGDITTYGTQKGTRSGTVRFDAADPSKMEKLSQRIKDLGLVSKMNAKAALPAKAEAKPQKPNYEKVGGKVSKDEGGFIPKNETYQA